MLRLDCFAGNDGALVRYYQDAGFSATEQFSVGEWPGQVLQRKVAGPPLGEGRPMTQQPRKRAAPDSGARGEDRSGAEGGRPGPLDRTGSTW